MSYAQAVDLLTQLQGRMVVVEVESSSFAAIGHPPLSSMRGIFGTSDLLARVDSPFKQPVVAFFTVAADLVEGDFIAPSQIAIEEQRFAEAERILHGDEREKSVAEGGNVVIRLREGVKISVTWFDPRSEGKTGILRRD